MSASKPFSLWRHYFRCEHCGAKKYAPAAELPEGWTKSKPVFGVCRTYCDACTVAGKAADR